MEAQSSWRRLWTACSALPAALLLAIGTPNATAQGSPQGPAEIGYVFVIDVSGSMSGEAGHVNIFPQVIATITQFVRTLPSGTTVFVLPFQGHVVDWREFNIRRSQDIDAVDSYLAGLTAQGRKTAVYSAIARALEQVERFRHQAGGDRPVMFFVYTDGDDNASLDWTFPSILKHFSLKRGSNDWLFYTELGMPFNAERDSLVKELGRGWGEYRVGGVHPIIQIEPMIRVLDFGNLKAHANPTRAQVFAVRGANAVPSDLRLGIEAEFESVSAQGSLARLSPPTFALADSVALTLSLVNAEGLQDGTYRGRLRLHSSDPLVFIAPSEIEATFTFEPERTVAISPARGTEFPLDFGSVRRPRRGAVEERRGILLTFSETAVRAGQDLRYRLTEASANPASLLADTSLVIEEFPGEQGAVTPVTSSISIVIRVTSRAKSGRYRGAVLFGGGGITVSGPALEPQADGGMALPWSVTVRNPPKPWWFWVLVSGFLAGVGALTVRHVRRPAVLADLKLSVLQPERREIDLAGKSEVRLGEGGEDLQVAGVVFSIRAVKAKGRVSALVRVDRGEVLLKKVGVREESAIAGDEPIYDGDVLSLAEFRIRVSSFDLTRE